MMNEMKNQDQFPTGGLNGSTPDEIFAANREDSQRAEQELTNPVTNAFQLSLNRMTDMLQQLTMLLSKLERRHREHLASTMHDVVREELLRSNLVSSDVLQPDVVMKQLTAVLYPWLTQRPERQQLFCQHFLPIIGEKKVWMEADCVCVQCCYLAKFIRAIFQCMDEYHLSRFRTQRLETCISLRKFLEKRVRFKRDGKFCEPHLMVPISRAAPMPV